MAAKWEFTHRCEAPWRHSGTRKLQSHTYQWKINGEYRRLCWPCWQKVDAERGIKRGVKES